MISQLRLVFIIISLAAVLALIDYLLKINPSVDAVISKEVKATNSNTAAEPTDDHNNSRAEQDAGKDKIPLIDYQTLLLSTITRKDQQFGLDLGHFSSEEATTVAQQNLDAIRYPNKIVTVKLADDIIRYILVVGPFDNQDEAVRIQGQLKTGQLVNSFVILYPK